MNAMLWAGLVLLAGAAACLLPVSNRLRVAFGLSSQSVAMVLALMVAVPLLAGAGPVIAQLQWAAPVGALKIRVDALGAFFLSWSLPMTLLGSIYAVGYLRRYFDSARHMGVHFALLNLTALAFLLVYTADHALVFLLGWEIAALAAWLLVIWDYPRQKVRFAGFNYLVSTHIGLIFLVAAFMILYTHTGSWDLADFGIWLRTHPGSERNAVFLLLLASFALKSAFFPFHSWLPRAHAAAPAHVSALMSGVIHKAGLYALVRFILLIETPDAWMGWFLLGFGLLSAVMGALYTVGQRDLKRLLGYSSTENVGIAAMGLGIGVLGLAWGDAGLVAIGFTGGLLHILNHAFFKCQLFYAAGSVYQATHTVDVERLGGLARLMPWTTLAFAVGGVAISALPPFNGFVSEFTIYSGLFSSQPPSTWARVALCVVAAGLALVGAVSALSITRALGVAFLGRAREPAAANAHEVSAWMLVPTLLHAAGVLLLGVVPAIGFAMVSSSVQIALAHSRGNAAPAMASVTDALSRVGIASGVLVLAVAGVYGLYAGTRRTRGRLAPTWGCGYSATNVRMQYTGSAFAWDFASRFRAVMVLLRRRKPVLGYFPQDAYVITDCVDAVERRLFTMIKHGDESAERLSREIREDDPRVAFAAGLLALILIAGLVFFGHGALG